MWRHVAYVNVHSKKSRLLTVLPPGTNKIESVGELPDLRSPSREYSVERGATTHKRKKRTKGWDGEIADDAIVLNAVDGTLRIIFYRTRTEGFTTIHR